MLGSDLHEYEMNVWGVIATLPKFALLFPKAVKVMMPRKLDRRTKRGRCLHKNLPGNLSPSGAASDLSEQLECAFTSSKVGSVKSDICIDNAHQSDIRKIETLGDHLRADENVDLSTTKTTAGLSIRIRSYHGIGIHASQPGFWKKLLDDPFDLFGAEAGVTDSGIRAFGTSLGDKSNMAAQMAFQPLFR